MRLLHHDSDLPSAAFVYTSRRRAGSSTCVPLARQSISEISIMLIDLHEYRSRQANSAERQETAKEDEPQLPKFVTCRCVLVLVVDQHSHKLCLLAVWFQESVFRLCPSRTACPGMPYPLCSTTLRPDNTYVYYRSTVPADLVAWRAVVVYGSLYRTDIWTQPGARTEICADPPYANTDRARSSTRPSSEWCIYAFCAVQECLGTC